LFLPNTLGTGAIPLAGFVVNGATAFTLISGLKLEREYDLWILTVLTNETETGTSEKSFIWLGQGK
jgi:hypothetical protein